MHSPQSRLANSSPPAFLLWGNSTDHILTTLHIYIHYRIYCELRINKFVFGIPQSVWKLYPTAWHADMWGPVETAVFLCNGLCGCENDNSKNGYTHTKAHLKCIACIAMKFIMSFSFKPYLFYNWKAKIKYRWWYLLSSVCPTAPCLSAAVAQHAIQEQFPGQGTTWSADTHVSNTQMPALLWKKKIKIDIIQSWIVCLRS